MAFDPDNCSFMLLGVDDTLQTNMACENETLKSSKQGKVLRGTIDKKHTFSLFFKS